MKKLALLLALLTLTSVFASCSDNSGTSADTTAAAETTTAEETTTADPLDDELPEKNYEGYDFRFYVYGDFDKTYAPDTETGDVVNDAVYQRNSTVEERFNITISTVNSGETTYSKQTPAIEKLILAGDDSFDVAVNYCKQLTGQSLSGYFVNIHDIDVFNFDKPWWSKKLVEDLTYMDCMFVFSNNIAYEEFAASKVFYFNKDTVNDLGIDDPYQTVFDGKWTLDEFISITRDVYSDLNGDGQKGIEDSYGLLTTTSHNTWQLALDIPVWQKNADSLVLVANSDKANTAYTKLYDFYYNSPGLYLWHSFGNADKPMRQMFVEGKGMFSFGLVGDSGVFYRDTDVDYGIVPFPKYDENQDGYRVFFGANSANAFAIPITASDLERTGIIIEAMSAEGYKSLIPAYYEVALKAKYLRDENSVKMLDLVTANRTISFSYCYDDYSKASVDFGMALAQGSDRHTESYATFYASRENIVNERLKVITEAFAKAK